MKRSTKIILIACGVIIVILSCLFYFYTHWVIVPTKSSSHTLTLVADGYLSPNKVTLRYYVNNVHTNDYVLELKGELWDRKPQTYELPQLQEGRVEVDVELDDKVSIPPESICTLTINYENAQNLYEKGVLIYFSTDLYSRTTIGRFVYYDQYVHFISGANRISYIEKAGPPNWSIIIDAPSPKKITPEGNFYFPYDDSDWKEKNKWVVVSPAKT